MPRLEYVEGSSSKFYEVEAIDKVCQIRYGKIGTPGKGESKVFGSAALAKAEAEKMIREKMKKGYKEVAANPAAGVDDQKDLETAIFNNPGDDNAWQVYADFLQQQNNPLGEYCALSIQGKTNTAAKKAAEKLLEKHGKKWLGKLFEQEYVELKFHNGFLSNVRVAMEYDGEPDVATLLRAVLSLELGKFLATLRVGVPQDDGENDMSSLGEILVKGGIRRGLRNLYFGDFSRDECEVSWAGLPDIAPFATVFPDLELLHIKGAYMKLGDSVWPNLKSFTHVTGGLPSLSGMINAKWPKLEHLEVWFGREYYGCKATPQDLQKLLARKDMPSLVSLGIVNHEFGNVITPMVLASPLLPKLKRLDLSKSTLSDASGEQLLAQWDKLTHLEALDLSQNFFSKPMVARFKEHKQVNVKDQRSLEQYSYYDNEVGPDGEPKRYCVLGE